MVYFSTENIVLIGALLLFVAVMAGKLAYRFGAPALLLFLGVGMLFGWHFISYRSLDMTQFIGMIALCVILFTGGMDTKFSDIRPVIGPGVLLATVGVIVTAFIVAGLVWFIAPWLGIEMPFALALLLASTMASTDSASVFSILLFVAVMAGKLAYRFGAPALLLFLGVGMLFGWHFISYRSLDMTQFIGMIALCVILFTGGMDTKFSDIRPVIGPGVLLATVGVIVTAFIVAGLVWFIAPWLGIEMPFALALLLASTMASTDSASVFSILRTKKQGLSQNLRPLLELESGSNDPMAYMLTVLLVGVLTSPDAGGMGIGSGLLMLVVQLVVGALSGYLIGRLAVWTINRINLTNTSLYSVLLLAFIFFSFSFTDLLRGNGYLAVYISGLVVGNYKLTQKRTLTIFFDGFTWLVQIVMFLTLGLFVNSHELFEPRVLIFGVVVAACLMLVGRPVSVLLCMAPFRRFSAKARLYVSWVGLRGAVPIIFATYPLMAGVEHAELLFNVVFIGTIISLLVQGTTVSGMANLLGLAFKERKPSFDVDMQDNIHSVLTEVEVNEGMLENGHTLSRIILPDNTLVMMVCRDGEYFVPQGKTELKVGDKLLVISDRGEELATTYKDMGIDDVMKL